MAQRQEFSAEHRRRRERTTWRTGLAVSVALHLLLLIGWRGSVLPESPFAAAGPEAGDNRAAAGGLQAINVRTPPTRPIVPPPVPVEVAVDVDPVDFEDDIVMDPSSVMGDAPGPLEAPGTADGSGAGDGGDADEGRRSLQPAAPRGMIIPPTNRDLRGTEVQVWVFVDERGRVVADSTRLDPPTRDRGFNRRLIQEAAQWVFRPAVQEGQPVASWFPYRISM